MHEVQEILESLKNSEWWARKNCIDKLVNYPEDSYLSVLDEWLRKDDDALIRNVAMEAYRAIGTKSLKSLMLLINDNDSDIRIFAANLLGDIKNSEALPSLSSALNDPEDNVKIAAAEAIGKIGDENALNVLQEALNADQWIAISALQAIGEIGGERALDILYDCLENEEFQSFAISAIGKAGNKQSIKHLTPFIDRGDHIFNRELALNAVIKIAERESLRLKPENFSNVVPMLIEAINSPDIEVRKPAFIALCWSEDIKGIPYFIDAIKDEDLQEYAIDGLLSIGRKAAPAIVEALKDSDGDHRVILAKVLSMLGEDRALLHFKKDENPDVRTEVALALGSLNSDSSASALLKMLSDPSEDVRISARRSLDKLNMTR
jgi:HEAT repeat protein